MIERKMIVSKKTITYLALLFIWLPAYSMYSFIPGAGRFLLILRLASSTIIIIKNWGMRVRKEHVIIIGFATVEIITTILNNSSELFSAVEFCICIIAMCVFFSNLGTEGKKSFRNATACLSLVYIIGSVIVCFTTPNEIRENLGLHFFVSSRANTAQTMICLLAILIALDYKIIGKVSCRSYLILGLTALDMVGLHSGQGIIMLGIIIVTLLVFTRSRNDKLLKLFSPSGVYIVNIFLNWLIISQVYMKINLITQFITDVLKKDVTLTGRDVIYTNIVAIYLGSPWIGYGYKNNIVENTLSRFAAGYNSAHNSPFQLLIEVGLIGFLFFSLLVFYILTQLRKAKTRQSYTLYGAIIAFLIGGIASLAYYNIYFYVLIMFSVGMYTDDMSEEGEN